MILVFSVNINSEDATDGMSCSAFPSSAAKSKPLTLRNMEIFFFFFQKKNKMKISFGKKKKIFFFNILVQNKHCGSNEYPQCMFWIKNKKIRYTTANHSFFFIKVGFTGVFISRT